MCAPSQNFFRSYPKLAGMTGTAATEADEFSSIYNLAVAVVPTNRPVTRTDNADVVFRTEQGKWKAVVTEVTRMHESGRPVLVGTTSVERSEELSAALDAAGIRHQVLNAKPENVERESEIVAQSGRRGGVTIATNMAGRGTDILLGGNPEFMARLKLREALMPRVVSQVEELEKAAGKKNGKAKVGRVHVGMECLCCWCAAWWMRRWRRALTDNAHRMSTNTSCTMFHSALSACVSRHHCATLAVHSGSMYIYMHTGYRSRAGQWPPTSSPASWTQPPLACWSKACLLQWLRGGSGSCLSLRLRSVWPLPVRRHPLTMT